MGSDLVPCDASYVIEIRVGKLGDSVNPKHSVQEVKKMTRTATREHSRGQMMVRHALIVSH